MTKDRKSGISNSLSKRLDKDEEPEDVPSDPESEQDDEPVEESSGDDPNPVRNRAARTMYAGKDVIEEIDIKYEQLSPVYRREHGEKLSKNDVFYPALLRAGLYGTSLEEELELEGLLE